MSSKDRFFCPKPPGKHHVAKTGQTSPFLGFTKKISTLPHVVWTEDSKTGLGFEIGPSYGDVPTRSQCLTEGQSSCIANRQEMRSTVLVYRAVTLNQHTAFLTHTRPEACLLLPHKMIYARPQKGRNLALSCKITMNLLHFICPSCMCRLNSAQILHGNLLQRDGCVLNFFQV